jgi:hypothetical protein
MLSDHCLSLETAARTDSANSLRASPTPMPGTGGAAAPSPSTILVG